MSLSTFIEVCMSLILEHSVTACINITEEITVQFRTSETEQFPGFEMNVICYRPGERDLPGKLQCSCFRLWGGGGGGQSEMEKDSQNLQITVF